MACLWNGYVACPMGDMEGARGTRQCTGGAKTGNRALAGGLLRCVVAVVVSGSLGVSCSRRAGPEEASAAVASVDLMDAFEELFPDSRLLSAKRGERTGLAASPGFQQVWFATFLVFGVTSEDEQDAVVAQVREAVDAAGIDAPVLVDFYTTATQNQPERMGVRSDGLVRRVVVQSSPHPPRD